MTNLGPPISGIMLFQELLGSLLDCFWIGLIFLKMSRPKKSGNFDIILGHLWGTSGLFTTPHTP